MKKWRAYTVYLFMEGFLALSFSMIFAASSVYQVTVAGLSPLQLVLVGTTLEFSVFLFEIPTGVVADVHSRRLSIIIGVFLIGAGFILEGSIPLFWTILLAQIMWGLGYTFTSGATEAWITDEIGEDQAGLAFLRSNQIGQVMALLGIGIGIVLGNLRVNIPILFGGAGFLLLAILLIGIMPETGFQSTPRDQRSSWRSMARTFREGLNTVRRRPALKMILAIGLVYGLYSEGLDRLWTKHLLDNFSFPIVANWQPIVWIGLTRAVGMLLAIGAVEIVKRRVNTSIQSEISKALFGMTGVLFASLVGFAVTGNLMVALCAIWMTDVAREVISPLYTAWVNYRLDSRVRATVLSMSGQVDAMGQIMGGPGVGLIGNLLSTRAALLASSLILSPALALYQRLMRVEPEAEVVPGEVA